MSFVVLAGYRGLLIFFDYRIVPVSTPIRIADSVPFAGPFGHVGIEFDSTGSDFRPSQRDVYSSVGTVSTAYTFVTPAMSAITKAVIYAIVLMKFLRIQSYFTTNTAYGQRTKKAGHI